MRPLFLLFSLGLATTGCSNNSTNPQNDAAPMDVTTADVTADAGPYLPAGYTQMPFLTPSATTHTFTMAQQVIDSTHDYVAVLDTDQGRIVIHLLSQIAPITCNSFVFLTLNHFYDGILWHRVIAGFVAQTGDPNTISGARSTWGQGGPGYMFGTEVNPAYNFNDAGVVGMAREMALNTNGSQFFITLAAADFLDQMYTVWAEQIEGADVLQKLALDPEDDAGNDLGPPAMPSVILDAYIGVK
jgi:cyclophilin family peptidyl-prolyl cis-trans isomerase